MGIESRSRDGVLETENDLHWGTDPPASRSGQADRSPNRWEWIRDSRHCQSVRCFEGSQASELLHPEARSSRTELRHLWSGSIGLCANTKTVGDSPRGHQLQGLNLVRPKDSRIVPDIQSTLQKTSQVVGYSFGLRHHHRTPGWHRRPCRWPVLTTRLRDRLRKACGLATGNCPSGTIWWPHASNCRGAGVWLLGCWHLGKASRPTSCRRHIFSGEGDSMGSCRRSIDLRGEHICSCGWFSTRTSHKSIPWHPWVRSSWSSYDYWAGIQGFLLASNALTRS